MINDTSLKAAVTSYTYKLERRKIRRVDNQGHSTSVEQTHAIISFRRLI